MFYITFLYKYKCIIYIPSPKRNVIRNRWYYSHLQFYHKNTSYNRPYMGTLDYTIICWYMSPPKQKWKFSLHSNNKLRMSFLLTDMFISFWWYILSKAILIVSSRDTLVNKDFTSNYIISEPWGTFTFHIFSMKSFVLLTVY